MALQILGLARLGPPCVFPLYSNNVSAGFPSPAQDYIEQSLDLNELCIQHPTATFFVRVSGDSMKNAGIYAGDVLIVDRALQAQHGDIVVAALNHEFTVKELWTKPCLQLHPHNPAYPIITPCAADEFEIFGVVTNVIRKMKRR